jgi:hypothetical protein
MLSVVAEQSNSRLNALRIWKFLVCICQREHGICMAAAIWALHKVLRIDLTAR